ncbi:MAG: DUF6273 domain-containing protein [Oscillospiraceae bacterium]|nr:DUF6273 domain-containing protein [Oscillospiraceae bacterium]
MKTSTTTKIFALILALIMLFSLTACSDSGNNNSGGSTNTPPPSETPSAPSPNGAQGNGDNDPGTGVPDPGNGVIFNDGSVVSDLGPVPSVVWPLENHRGDPQYFYTVEWDDMLIYDWGENYIVTMEEGFVDLTLSDVTIYSLFTFTGAFGEETVRHDRYKTVFPSNEEANEVVNMYGGSGYLTVVDNVVYGLPYVWAESLLISTTQRKSEIISLARDTEGMLCFIPEGEGNNNPGVGDLSGLTNIGDVITFGGYYWRVLDVQDGRALVISGYILERREYHSPYGEITWEHSSIRDYLNGEFLSSFSQADQARIIETTLINNNNPTHDTPGGNNTVDKIFLLSIDEAQQYFANDSARVAYESDGRARWWWLRSPGIDANYVAYVDYEYGSISDFGMSSDDYSYGVRPAMWVKLS